MMSRRPGSIAVVLATVALLAACGDDDAESARDCGDSLACPNLAETIETPGADPANEQAVPGALDERVRALNEIGLLRGVHPVDAARGLERDFGAREVASVADEVVLAAQDRKRVWWEDTEVDVIEGNGTWVDTLKAWSRISRGALRPTDVSEDWDAPEGPVTLRFTLGGERHEVKAAGMSGWLDLCVIPKLNAVIDGDRKLAVVRASDQFAAILALTPDEQRALEERRWRFAEGEQLREAFELGRAGEDEAVGDPGCDA